MTWRKCVAECIGATVGADDVQSSTALGMFVFHARWPFPEVVNRDRPVSVSDWLWLKLEYVIVRHVEQKVHVAFAGA